mmetsp:Transcript_22971/g.40661  ORF Transcript_22971/g.40661 Transcript_22971/m.40661 type:complete len:108 (-) Transcript_22971:147-470(-)
MRFTVVMRAERVAAALAAPRPVLPDISMHARTALRPTVQPRLIFPIVCVFMTNFKRLNYFIHTRQEASLVRPNGIRTGKTRKRKRSQQRMQHTHARISQPTRRRPRI